MYKTINGLVLGRTRFSDSHAYLNILTEEGKISVLAHGIMSPKNKNFSSCLPYTYSEFVLKVTGDKITLSQATALRYLIKEGVDFEKLTLANYIVSMARDTAYASEDAGKILEITVIALKMLSLAKCSGEIVKAVFELRLMNALGFCPDFSGCLNCGKKVEDGYFVLSDGAFICDKCNYDERQRAVKVQKELTLALEHFFSLSEKESYGIRFSDPVLENAFITLAERFSLEHLDCASSALNFYKENLKNF